MGNRATYALVEAGAVTYYYEHWGGYSIPGDVLAGPGATAAYLRGLEAADALLDAGWAEGGILLDADRRRLLLWGGVNLRWNAYLRRPYLPALRRRWPGWRVEWPVEGVADFARHLGVDPASVLSTEADPGDEAPASVAELRRSGPADEMRILLTVRWADGRVTDHALHEAVWTAPVLVWGPPVLDQFRDRASDALPSEALAHMGAFLDVPSRALWVYEPTTLDPRYLAGLRRRWPGWRVRGHTEGLVRQVALSGREPRAVPGLVVPEAEAIAELRTELTADFGYDGARELPGIAALIRAQNGPDTQIEINPAALGRHVPALSVAARRRIVHDLFGTDATELTPSR
jgi:hypothetical protein